MGDGIVRLALILTTLAALMCIACQDTAPQTLGEKVVSIDGQATYAKRADDLIQSISNACSLLVTDEDVLEMAVTTRDTFQDDSGTEVSVLQVLEAANFTVMSSETKPVDCDDIFFGAVIQLIVEDAVAGQ